MKNKISFTDQHLFTSFKNSNKAMDVRSLRRRIDTYLENAKLKKDRLSAHSLRVTSSSLLLDQGCSILEIQQHLNHRNVNTTLRYLYRLGSMRNKVSEKIPVKF
jgi:integrase